MYNEKGVHPDPPKIEDIKTLESPANEATCPRNGDLHGPFYISFI